MKPVAFDYERPTSMDVAIKLLGDESLFCKVLAGSQSLGPILNLRLAQPDLLLVTATIPELAAVANARGHVEIGACVTHADVEDGRVPDPSNGVLLHVPGGFARAAVRRAV